jgi:hypothetical protein
MTDTRAGVLGDLEALRGRVPKATGDRRAWLLGLTRAELLDLCREHGSDLTLNTECWGWGAHGAGLTDGQPRPRCEVCGRVTAAPLWFHALEPERDYAMDWRCAAVFHLTGCDRWA